MEPIGTGREGLGEDHSLEAHLVAAFSAYVVGAAAQV
jgi:hypothetical protein